MYNISYVKVVCLYTYNRIYTFILLVKKKLPEHTMIQLLQQILC